MSATDPLTAARELRSLIESEAERVEQSSTMTPPVVDALAAAGLFCLLVPRELGGIEADPDTNLFPVVDVPPSMGDPGKCTPAGNPDYDGEGWNPDDNPAYFRLDNNGDGVCNKADAHITGAKTFTTRLAVDSPTLRPD